MEFGHPLGRRNHPPELRRYLGHPAISTRCRETDGTDTSTPARAPPTVFHGVRTRPGYLETTVRSESRRFDMLAPALEGPGLVISGQSSVMRLPQSRWGSGALTTFGAKLREARLARGLSQTALGRGRFSGSYISHLERDTRKPSEETLAFLSEQLGVNPHALLADEEEPTPEEIAQTVAQTLLESSLIRHEYREELVTRAGLASARGPVGQRFSIGRLTAEALLERGAYHECVLVTDGLLKSALTEASPVLRAAVLAIRSRALRADGDLTEARKSASHAVFAAHAAEECPPEIMVSALTAEVAARADLGEREELARATAELESCKQDLPEGHVRGLAAWALGNVYFAEREVPSAIAQHDEAAELLRPEADLRAWARFYKATAALRLAAGVLDGVDGFIERASNGLSIVGNEGDLAELELLRAKRVLPSDPENALARIEAVLRRHELPGQTEAEAETVRAAAFELLGRREDQLRTLLHAAELLASSGAPDQAIDIWRAVVDLQRNDAREGSPPER